MKHFDPSLFAKEMATMVRDYSARAIDPVIKRLEAVETGLASIPRPDPIPLDEISNVVFLKLKPELDQVRTDAQTFAQNIDKMFAELPPMPEIPEVNPDDLKPIIAEQVKEAIAATPKPQDGQSVTVADVAPIIEEAVSKAVSGLPKPKDGVGMAGGLIDRDGNLVLTLTDGSTKEIGRVVGRDAEPAPVPSASPVVPQDVHAPDHVAEMISSAVKMAAEFPDIVERGHTAMPYSASPMPQNVTIKMPDVIVPEIKVPDIHVPEIKAPAVAVTVDMPERIREEEIEVTQHDAKGRILKTKKTVTERTKK